LAADIQEKTLSMTVANTGFMVDRLGQDCAPLQFLRELTQNGIEAIQATAESRGEIIWDVDWDYFALTGVYKLCIIDNGCGMTGEEMVRYINALSSSVHVQAHDGNYGVGAKIAAATRNHAGLLYLSWKDNVGATIHLWRDPLTGAYGLRQMQLPGTERYGHWAKIDDTVKPDDDLAIQHHGTKVVLLGNEEHQDTMTAPPGTPSPSRWIGRYLNTRYFRFPEGVTVKAREGWTNPRADKDRNLLRTITGQEQYLEAHKAHAGVTEVTGARVRWWVLKDDAALSQNSGFVASSGHVAALYRDELYEMQTGRAGVARLQLFGVIFGHHRVVLYVEPLTGEDRRVSSNTARTQLLLNSEPLPWTDWAAEFRANLPKPIQQLMEEITAGSSATDHKQAIRERLRQVKDLLKFSRYRPTPNGDKLIGEDVTAGGESATSDKKKKPSAGGRGGGGGGRGGNGGNIYALFLIDENGQPAEEVLGAVEPIVQWVTAAEGTRTQGLLEDRAAKFLPEQNVLQINGDFRAFTDMVDRWCNFYSHVPGARHEITEVTREWFEQALVETVMGVQALKESRQWTQEDILTSLSEEALTAAVMPRYHVDVAVKRALGSKLGTIKDKTA
jgi:hypothetical protein